MNLTYWTTYIEPKRCVKDPFECELSEYTVYLEGVIELFNVDVKEFKDDGKDSIEIRLAFNQHTKALVNVYDIYKFTFPWTKSNIKLKEGWKCQDGYAKEEKANEGKQPEIDIKKGSKDEDSFKLDRAQDCIVDNDLSNITISDNKVANIKVHFLR